jgi:hypothetical protein
MDACPPEPVNSPLIDPICVYMVDSDVAGRSEFAGMLRQVEYPQFMVAEMSSLDELRASCDRHPPSFGFDPEVVLIDDSVFGDVGRCSETLAHLLSMILRRPTVLAVSRDPQIDTVYSATLTGVDWLHVKQLPLQNLVMTLTAAAARARKPLPPTDAHLKAARAFIADVKAQLVELAPEEAKAVGIT